MQIILLTLYILGLIYSLYLLINVQIDTYKYRKRLNSEIEDWNKKWDSWERDNLNKAS
jgi:hypothetical protein